MINSKTSDGLVNQLQTPDCGLEIRCPVAHFPISSFHAGLVVSSLNSLSKTDGLRTSGVKSSGLMCGKQLWPMMDKSARINNTELKKVEVHMHVSTYGYILAV